MNTTLFLNLTGLCIVTVIAMVYLARQPRLQRFRTALHSVAFAAQLGVIASVAFFCLVCVRIIIAVATNHYSIFALPFINIISSFLVLPLALLIVKSWRFYFRPPAIRSYRQTFLYLVTCVCYLACLHFGLILLGMSMVSTTLAKGVMVMLIVLSAGFYLYTYRQCRSMLR